MISEFYENLSHSRWNCKCHVVFVPKRRRRVLFGHVRRHLAKFSTLCPSRKSARFSASCRHRERKGKSQRRRISLLWAWIPLGDKGAPLDAAMAQLPLMIATTKGDRCRELIYNSLTIQGW